MASVTLISPALEVNIPLVTCLLKNIDDWRTGLDSGQMLGMVFVDLKKAFHTVDHRVPSDRKQYCRVGEYYSKIWGIEAVVPRGSCLGSCS